MNKKVMAVLWLTAGAIALIAGCSKSSEDQLALPVPPTCDTTNMTYTTNVKPILQANCYSCHGSDNSLGGEQLDTYEGVKNAAEDGHLLGVITHAAGYPPMPQGGTKLSDCDINKIRAWINQGAVNN